MLMIPVSFPRPLINKSVRKTWRGKCFHLSMTTFQRRVLDIWASFSSWLPGGFSFGFAACVHVLLMIVSIAVVGISHAAAAAAAAAVQQHQQAKLTNETKEKRDHRPSFHLEAAASFHVDPVGLLLLSFFFVSFLNMFLLSARLWIIFHVVWRSTNHRYVAALDNWKCWSQLWKSSTKQKPIDFSFLSHWAPAFHVDYLIYATEQWRGGFHLEKKNYNNKNRESRSELSKTMEPSLFVIVRLHRYVSTLQTSRNGS